MRLKKTMAAVLAATTLTGLAACGGVGRKPVPAAVRKKAEMSMTFLAEKVHTWGDFCGVPTSEVRNNDNSNGVSTTNASTSNYRFCDYTDYENVHRDVPYAQRRLLEKSHAIPASPKERKGQEEVTDLNTVTDSAYWYTKTMYETGIVVDKTRLVDVSMNQDGTLTATTSSDLLGRFAAWPEEDDWGTTLIWTHRDKLVEYKDVRLTATLDATGEKILKLTGNEGRYEWYLGPNVYGKPKTEDASLFAAIGKEKRRVSYAPVLKQGTDTSYRKGYYLCGLFGHRCAEEAYDSTTGKPMEWKDENGFVHEYDDYDDELRQPLSPLEQSRLDHYLNSTWRFAFTQAPKWHATVKANTNK